MSEVDRKEEALRFEEFEAVDWDAWEQKLLADLKGRSLVEAGLKIDGELQLPIAFDPDHPIPPLAIPGGPDLPRLTQQPASLANEAILELLQGGVDSLRIKLLPKDQLDWEQVLKTVELSFLDLQLTGDPKGIKKLLQFLITHVRLPASGGNLDLAIEEELTLFQAFHSSLPAWRFFHMRPDDGFTSPVQMLASVLRSAQRRLVLLADQGNLKVAQGRITIELLVGAQYLTSIMCIRAMRLLWALLMDSWGLDAQRAPFIYARLNERAYDADDLEKNMIRQTSMYASAVLGGADSILTEPVPGAPEQTDFYRRIARNNLHIFAQEGHLGWVNDPAAGAPYIERGTELIAEKAWDLFRSS